ncbi:FAD-dependent pyridine nucleotide-disulphide oxidoreductase [Hymenobacter roseosalivarius DSM 11622]|uniref:FAD-dependent pyridine nucleotide-disulphide oxidoreductase n=1 Tax=Hymenobacter roseosalivarius DSM 11622 TaxID=645990 RepID=A0A1W1VP13_9BACT|nr:NAD(P)/FAD-dependent oxidoreductase [Hymenobacter roseosalivarius]SMB95115.1 FAD-dependent pyridine nucleotide-disulphide oxidoreductase [Hymenobacter roseosalivarius DSM 11622]
MTSPDDFSVDTLIIGAGQAGLAAAYYLQRRGAPFVILDERAAVGEVWASRFEALRLFSPAWASGLPGLEWPGGKLRYPTKDEAAAYLNTYAGHFHFPIHLYQRVARVSSTPNGYAVNTTTGQQYQARRVVVCTGSYNAPRRPEFAPQLPPTVVQLHSRDYQQPQQVAGTGPVAVVGSGNSALQIAADLAATSRPVYVAYDERTPAMPNNMLMWAMLTTTRLLRASRHSVVGGHMMRQPEPVVSGDLAKLRTYSNVQFIGRALGAEPGGILRGRHASTPPLEAVVWSTGYGPDFSWIEIPVFDAAGYPAHYRGLTAAPGLAFLGLPWLNSRGSALMGGVGPDARYVVDQLLEAPPQYTASG